MKPIRILLNDKIDYCAQHCPTDTSGFGIIPKDTYMNTNYLLLFWTRTYRTIFFFFFLSRISHLKTIRRVL